MKPITKLLCVALLLALFSSANIWAVGKNKIKTVVYKEVNDTKLTLKCYQVDSKLFKGDRPAIIFFFGGGWKSRNIDQFEKQAEYFAQKGVITFVADYRVEQVNNTTPYESVKDAKSAVRYVRSNAKKLGVDANRIAASGGSAGGHIATCTALIDKYNESSDDTSVSCKADALLLFNPVLDNSVVGYGYDRVGESYKDFSPLHNIKEGVPPTIMFLGDSDNLIPVETLKYYAKACEKLKGISELHIYEGEGHGFFNKEKYFDDTMKKCTAFLKNIGYID